MIILWPLSSGNTVVSGTASCVPPTQPTLAVNADGTLATVSGGDAGSTNQIEILEVTTGYGSYTWTAHGSSFDGDGSVALSLTPGRYWARDTATNADGSAVSNLVYFRVGSPGGSLNHSPADILRHTLVNLGKGIDPDVTTPSNSNWPFSVAQEAEAPDNVITAYDTDGRDFGRALPTGQRLEHHGVQLRVRASTFTGAYARTNLLAVTMDEDIYQEVTHIGSSSYFVHSVSRTTRPIYLGREPGTGRHVFTINVTVNLYLIQ